MVIVGAARGEVATERHDPPAHPFDAVSVASAGGLGRRADDRDHDLIGPVVDGDSGRLGDAMAQHVGQGLLHDPIAGHVDRGRQGTLGAVRLNVDLGAGVRHAALQVIEPRQPRFRR